MKEEIKSYLEQVVLKQGYFVVKVTVSQNNNQINVFLDGDNGIDVDECGKVNKMLQKWLDEEPSVPDNYLLDVSSPGIDEPLVNLRQFKRNIQRPLKIRRKEIGEDIRGKLIYVDAKELAIEIKNRETFHLSFDDIAEAKVEIANI